MKKILLSVAISLISPEFVSAGELIWTKLEPSNLFIAKPAREIHNLQLQDFIDDAPTRTVSGSCISGHTVSRMRDGQMVEEFECTNYSEGETYRLTNSCNLTSQNKKGNDGPNFLIFHNEAIGPLSTLRIVSKGRFYKSGDPESCRKFDSPKGMDGLGVIVNTKFDYVPDPLNRLVRLEDLRLGSVKMRLNRFEKRTGLNSLLMAGSHVRDEYLELVESKEKHVVLDWQAPQSLDDNFNRQVRVAYYFDIKKWAITFEESNSYSWEKKDKTFIEASFRETEDSIIVTVKNILTLTPKETEFTFKSWVERGKFVSFSAPLMSKLTDVVIESAGFTIQTPGVFGTYGDAIGAKEYGFRFNDMNELVKKGIVQIRGTEILIPVELLEKTNEKFKKSVLRKKGVDVFSSRFTVNAKELPFSQDF